MENLFSIKNFLLDLFFPVFCLNCGKEGEYLCQNCFSLIDVSSYTYCPFCSPLKIVLNGLCNSCKRKHKNLSGLFSVCSYQNFVVRNLIKQFKYHPYVKDLAKTLAHLIIHYFNQLETKPDFSNSFFIPIPITNKKLKTRGFNQAEEITKELCLLLSKNNIIIPYSTNVLIKTKDTIDQTELSEKERFENVKDCFKCINPDKINGKKIFLIDDVFTTGSTMEECARILKLSGAKQVWGITIAKD